MKYSVLITLIILVSFTGCHNLSDSKKPTTEVARLDSFYGSIIADTIIYDVIIRNTNPEDIWGNQCLQYLNHRMLVDSLFALAYEGKLVVIDFFTNSALTAKDLRKLEDEPGFTREEIGKIQFTERWYLDTASKQLQKEVLSVVLGYELYSDEGTVRGYKPVFKIFLNH